MSNFTKRKYLSEENWEEILNKSEDSEINGQKNMPFKNISKPTSFKSEEDNSSDDEKRQSDNQHGKWTKTG